MKTVSLILALIVAIAARTAGAEPDLPLIEVPASAAAPADAPLMIFMSGDGGWAEFVREISRRLSADGWSVVGLNLRKYLSTRRTPDEAAAAVDTIVRRYRSQWRRDRVIIAGFSRGADIAPFVVNRLSPESHAHVALLVLLSPGPQAEFEFHIADFLRTPPADALKPVAEEITRLGSVPLLILHGAKDDEALALPAAPGRIIKLPGDHHLDHDYPTIIKLIEAAEHGARAANPPSVDARGR
jgi:type IV secretory pathway VirJ component